MLLCFDQDADNVFAELSARCTGSRGRSLANLQVEVTVFGNNAARVVSNLAAMKAVVPATVQQVLSPLSDRSRGARSYGRGGDKTLDPPCNSRRTAAHASRPAGAGDGTHRSAHSPARSSAHTLSRAFHASPMPYPALLPRDPGRTSQRR